MIKVELEIRNIDYDSLIEQFLPMMIDKLRQSNNPAAKLISAGMPASMAKAILKKLPQSIKDQLAADLINSNKEKIAKFLMDTALQNNMPMKCGEIKAKAVNA